MVTKIMNMLTNAMIRQVRTTQRPLCTHRAYFDPVCTIYSPSRIEEDGLRLDIWTQRKVNRISNK
jgi:putative component of membrane protein insertase Oxa1/YidC/SpoIIIJ protein YidD